MENISDILIDWYARCGRDLPWRRTRNPYLIWLSEVILQQTRVAQGMEYYLRFTERFPDIAALAAAPEDEVLKQWQGLGYYSRARNLRAAARQVVERFGGVFPATFGEVRSLRGVGDYTAAAVCSAAYDAPCAVLDGNVYRVLARLSKSIFPSTPQPESARSPSWRVRSSIPPVRDSTTRQSWISGPCSARRRIPAAGSARLRGDVWHWRPELWLHDPSSRQRQRCATVGSITCT